MHQRHQMSQRCGPGYTSTSPPRFPHAATHAGMHVRMLSGKELTPGGLQAGAKSFRGCFGYGRQRRKGGGARTALLDVKPLDSARDLGHVSIRLSPPRAHARTRTKAHTITLSISLCHHSHLTITPAFHPPRFGARASLNIYCDRSCASSPTAPLCRRHRALRASTHGFRPPPSCTDSTSEADAPDVRRGGPRNGRSQCDTPQHRSLRKRPRGRAAR